MMAMVLAAGFGERMRPLTNTTPKPLLPVAGTPLLGRHLEALSAAGFTDVVVNASWLAEQIVDYCGNGQRWGLNIEVVVEAEPLETAGGVINALPLLGSSPFLLVNGDVFTDFDFSRMHNVALDAGHAMLVLVSNPAHHPQGDFSLLQRRVVARLESAPSYTYSGIGVYQASFFEAAAPGKQPLRPWLDRAIARRHLLAELWPGVWEDVGTPERLAQLDMRLQNAH